MSLSSVHVVLVLLRFTDWFVIFYKNSCYLKVLKLMKKETTDQSPAVIVSLYFREGHWVISNQ